MKITTQQIKQIINEELNKLLYEQDNNDVLRQALEKKITDKDVAKFYKGIVVFIKQNYQKIQDPQALQDFKQKVLPNLDNIDTLPSFFGQFRSFVYFDEETESNEEKTALKIEEFLDAGKDKKSFIIDKMIETKNLSGSNLNSAILVSANLEGFNLSGADLSGAYLSEADLRNADLSDADLSDALLDKVKLQGAKLEGATLRRVELYQASYDERTQWPKGFDAQTLGAKKV